MFSDSPSRTNRDRRAKHGENISNEKGGELSRGQRENLYVSSRRIGLLIISVRGTWYCLRVWCWECLSILHGITTLVHEASLNCSSVLRTKVQTFEITFYTGCRKSHIWSSKLRGLPIKFVFANRFAMNWQKNPMACQRLIDFISGYVNWLSGFKAKGTY